MNDFLISVIIPVYEEEKQIDETLRVIDGIMTENGFKYEFVLIDDGSKDNTWEEIKKAASDMPVANAIRFSRNFGKEAALCAGLEAARGDACIVMDADLQHPPELIPQMVKLWKEDGFEVVEAVKSSRGKESLINKSGAGMFYNILNKLSGFNFQGASDFKLLDAKVVSAWRQMGERSTFFRGMSAWVGFRRTSIPFVVPQRKTGVSKFSFIKLFSLAVNAISSFSSMPLQIVTFIGAIFLIGSVLLGLQTLYMKIAGIAFSGFTTVILLLLVIGGFLMISLGIIGIYIAKIYDEVKFRPRYIVSDTIERKNKDAAENGRG